MKTINYILSLAGFSDINDYFGTYAILIKPLFLVSITSASLVGFIETYSGISFMLWVFLALGTIFDLAIGWYTNVYYLNTHFETKKFFRGILKSFITLSFIFLTNSLKVGVTSTEIHPEFLESAIIFISALIHYTIVFLIGLYLLLGIAENCAKMGIPVAKSIVKILKMRINSVEDMGASKEN